MNKNKKIKEWNIEKMTGYKPITTFWQDFSIADKFGKKAVLETFGRCFDEWKNNYKYLTELVMVLNWKLWEHHDNKNDLENVYYDLWEEADAYACETLKGEELSYFLIVTD